MVELRVLTMIFISPSRPTILVLEPNEAPRCVGVSRIIPINIGTPEAMTLSAAMGHVKTPRPMTHDLFLDALTNLDTRVDHAIITAAVKETFYAKLVLKQGERTIELDARPTDAIALALREGAPYGIEEDLLDKISFPYIFKEGADKEVELKRFDSFIESLSPEDLL